MIKLGGWIWEGTSSEVKPGNAEGSADGHVFKELDTGESYTRVAGVWTFINLGLSYIKATKSGRIITDTTGFYHVTFNTPFIATNYTVQLTAEDDGNLTVALSKNITVSGFDIQCRNKNGSPKGPCTISWLTTIDYNP
jgi:hypothetical protein